MKSLLRTTILIGSLIVVIFFSYDAADKNISPQTGSLLSDSLALVDFYDSTNGISWTNSTEWLTGPLVSWYGVTVEDGRVTDLVLNSNNLTDTIPLSIGNLDFLDTLELRDNDLRGSIPSTITSISSLHLLDLRDNMLVGNIPDDIGILSNLSAIKLSRNKLSGLIPNSIGQLELLWGLFLNDNDLTDSIPNEIGWLTKLEYLALDSNKLIGVIPETLGELNLLRYLDFGENNLSGNIPQNIWDKPQLEELFLYNNQLEGNIPLEMFFLKSLQRLSLRDNDLEGPIPNAIGNLTNLVSLRLDGNRLSDSIPAEIGSLVNLRELQFHTNELYGAIPEGISDLLDLEVFHLFDNEFDSLPNLSNLDSLQYMNISNNKFTFEDIEPNLDSSVSFTYWPQDSVGESLDTVLLVGSSFSFYLPVGGDSNFYKWKKNGEDIPGAESDTLNIQPISLNDAGAYICEINNTRATELTLYSKPINLIPNYSPVITSSPVDSILMGCEYGYQLSVVDSNHSSFNYSLMQGPIWLTIDNLGLLSGIAPDNIPIDSILIKPVIVRVSDGLSYTTQSFSLQVLPYKFEIVSFSPTELFVDWSLPGILDSVILKYGETISLITEIVNVWTNVNEDTITIGGLSENTLYYLRFDVTSSSNLGFCNLVNKLRTKVEKWSSSFPISDRSVNTGNEYSLLGIPYLADNNKLKDIFQRSSDAYDDKQLRVFKINKDGNNYEELNKLNWYSEKMLPGYSYLASSEKRLDLFAGEGVSLLDLDSMTITVPEITIDNKRWVMISNPFDNSIHINNFVDNLAQQEFYTFDRNINKWVIDTAGFINPYKSILVQLAKGGSVTLYNKVDTNNVIFSNKDFGYGWKGKISFSNSKADDSYNLYFGTNENSNEGRDYYDICAPPVWDKRTMYSFVNNKFPKVDSYIGDFRPTEKNFYEYEIVFDFYDEDYYKLDIEFDNLPKNFNYLIVDQENKTVFNLVELNSVPRRGKLNLIVGDYEYLKDFSQNFKHLPEAFIVHHNYPNPFNPTTTIQYELPEYSLVDVIIYDITGQEIKRLVNNEYQVGFQRVIWNGTNDIGNIVASGIYLYRVVSRFNSTTKKMIFLK